MDSFSNAPDIILDLIFLKLSEEDFHETHRVSKSWFWASIRRIKKLEITRWCNPLKSMADFFNNHRSPCEEELDWQDLFKHLVLDQLVVIRDKETTNYLVNNGCNTVGLTIEISEKGSPLTLGSLKRIHRLQSFECCFDVDMEWHPFIVECLKSSHCEFNHDDVCPIEKIKLNSSGWKTEDPVLKSVTKLGLQNVAIDFLRRMVDLCPNLEELHSSKGVITQNWHQVFPANVKRIELHGMKLHCVVAIVVDASTDSARHLLPYLCQNWESVDKFQFHGYINQMTKTVYEAFPQEREEVFECEFSDEEINLVSPHFQNRKIHVRCYDRKALELNIPPTKSIKFEFDYCDFKFSPCAVCTEPGQVEHLSLSLSYVKEFTPEPFGQSSFEGFSRLSSLTLHDVSALTIKMALDQCPSIRKIKLEYLTAFTLGCMPRGSKYANVCELVLNECEETMRKVFQVFPNLTAFKNSAVCEKQSMRKKKADCLRRYLIEEDKNYGIVFESTDEIQYMVSDDLQVSLNEAQMMLKYVRECECFLKGFKLIPRFSKQKVIYVD